MPTASFGAPSLADRWADRGPSRGDATSRSSSPEPHASGLLLLGCMRSWRGRRRSGASATVAAATAGELQTQRAAQALGGEAAAETAMPEPALAEPPSTVEAPTGRFGRWRSRLLRRRGKRGATSGAVAPAPPAPPAKDGTGAGAALEAVSMSEPAIHTGAAAAAAAAVSVPFAAAAGDATQGGPALGTCGAGGVDALAAGLGSVAAAPAAHLMAGSAATAADPGRLTATVAAMLYETSSSCCDASAMSVFSDATTTGECASRRASSRDECGTASRGTIDRLSEGTSIAETGTAAPAAAMALPAGGNAFSQPAVALVRELSLRAAAAGDGGGGGGGGELMAELEVGLTALVAEARCRDAAVAAVAGLGPLGRNSGGGRRPTRPSPLYVSPVQQTVLTLKVTNLGDRTFPQACRELQAAACGAAEAVLRRGGGGLGSGPSDVSPRPCDPATDHLVCPRGERLASVGGWRLAPPSSDSGVAASAEAWAAALAAGVATISAAALPEGISRSVQEPVEQPLPPHWAALGDPLGQHCRDALGPHRLQRITEGQELRARPLTPLPMVPGSGPGSGGGSGGGGGGGGGVDAKSGERALRPTRAERPGSTAAAAAAVQPEIPAAEATVEAAREEGDDVDAHVTAAASIRATETAEALVRGPEGSMLLALMEPPVIALRAPAGPRGAGGGTDAEVELRIMRQDGAPVTLVPVAATEAEAEAGGAAGAASLPETPAAATAGGRRAQARRGRRQPTAQAAQQPAQLPPAAQPAVRLVVLQGGRLVADEQLQLRQQQQQQMGAGEAGGAVRVEAGGPAAAAAAEAAGQQLGSGPTPGYRLALRGLREGPALLLLLPPPPPPPVSACCFPPSSSPRPGRVVRRKGPTQPSEPSSHAAAAAAAAESVVAYTCTLPLVALPLLAIPEPMASELASLLDPMAEALADQMAAAEQRREGAQAGGGGGGAAAKPPSGADPWVRALALENHLSPLLADVGDLIAARGQASPGDGGGSGLSVEDELLTEAGGLLGAESEELAGHVLGFLREHGMHVSGGGAGDQNL
ncbi:hypothetical protein GPECTOR_79g116 [Gonium pectorale]|uniref:Uncharacterized protein n=1 Tax=Gonium pectorale TaxID=33097 RepID=A0A150G1W0_GONPE|nr:hypothetical protein GPECTOR_79g116 [Gonium pectorale]|eukprot:KXZ43837.1 hypothetical protein GPECTOR_79g116 [Gonium pectorale]